MTGKELFASYEHHSNLRSYSGRQPDEMINILLPAEDHCCPVLLSIPPTTPLRADIVTASDPTIMGKQAVLFTMGTGAGEESWIVTNRKGIEVIGSLFGINLLDIFDRWEPPTNVEAERIK